jgi:hypothetical protein
MVAYEMNEEEKKKKLGVQERGTYLGYLFNNSPTSPTSPDM